MSETTTARDRWAATPRPLAYAKPRLYADDAKWLQGHLEDIQADTVEDLGAFRREGLPEDDPEIERCKADLERLANIIREVSRARIDLAGGEAG